MTELTFLSPDGGPAARLASPLARVLAGAPPDVRDLSLELAKLEVRGRVELLDEGLDVVRVTPRRALVLAPYADGAALRAELARRFAVLDVTGALAALAVTGPRAEIALRRMTELDLDALPAVGAVARVQAYVLRDGPEAFRLLVAQELAHYAAEVLLDALEGAG